MPRKGWNALKRETRERYERKGIDQAAYDRGESLKAARGHEHTPENPRVGHTKPEYRQYHNDRQQAEKAYNAHRRLIWADKYVKTKKGQGPPLNKPIPNVSVKDIKWATGKTGDEIIEAIKRDPKRFGGLGYR